MDLNGPDGPAVAVVGGGPAGLMAAECLSAAGVAVHLFDATPSVGRKFLLAGRGGLNLTHSEGFEPFVGRYGPQAEWLRPWLQAWGAAELRRWCEGLGVSTFVGSSGRVFPTDMKAAPLLRAWLMRLKHPAPPGVPVQFHSRHRWRGWTVPEAQRQADGGWRLHFDTPQGPRWVSARAVVLALGGGSWARLGSDGAWVPGLQALGVPVHPLQPSNCGFDVEGGWSAHFKERHAGAPFKSVAVRVRHGDGEVFERKGEFVATDTGVEGSVVYAASALLRQALQRQGHALMEVDLLPHLSAAQVQAEVLRPRGSKSWSGHLKSRLGLEGVKAALWRECWGPGEVDDPLRLAALLKAVPLRLARARPIDEAISSAGGLCRAALDEGLMVTAMPGVFAAGEMLDWEAPTGGYLLTACAASGRWAALGVLRYLGREVGPSVGPLAAA